MRYALFWDVTQHIMVIPYHCFGTTYQSCCEGWRIEEFLDSWLLKIGLIGCPKMPVRNYHYTLS